MSAKVPVATASDRYNHLAELFYQERRMFAPGKSIPAAMNVTYDPDKQQGEWLRWLHDGGKDRALVHNFLPLFTGGEDPFGTHPEASNCCQVCGADNPHWKDED